MPFPTVDAPVEQPMAAPPMMSGPPPTSGPPMSGPPFGTAAGGVRPARATVILAVVAGLLFLTGGVMTGLFVNTTGDLNRAEERISEQDVTIEATSVELEQVKVDLQRAQETLARTQQDLTGTQNDRDEQARQKEVIASCLDKLNTALTAAAFGDAEAFEEANEGLEEVCAEADDYL
ncbi:hypothetical protein [Salinispora vitiensis]|uniref:hypothetical protein n=1 Tax=Salinispora vitiensis TaxID=999544 RepID=UPI00039ED72B|nr:hypothetical protein [Salinispora vitiensis]